MIDNLLFFSIAIVSKSLLIVLGTLPLPAVIDRGKYRLAGIPKHSRKSGKNQNRFFLTFHRPCNSFITLPALLRDEIHTSTLREVQIEPAHPAYRQKSFSLRWQFFFSRLRKLYCAAVCPCQGDRVSHLARDGVASQAQSRLTRHDGEALTIPVRRQSQTQRRLMFPPDARRTGRTAVRAAACAPSVRTRCAATRPVIESAPYVGA